MTKIIVNEKEKDLREFIIDTLGNSNSSNFRDVDSAIDYISNIFQFSSELLITLYEKKILSIDDLKRILKVTKMNIKE